MSEEQGYVIELDPGFALSGDGVTASIRMAWIARIFHSAPFGKRWPREKRDHILTLSGDTEAEALEQVRIWAQEGHPDPAVQHE